MKCPYCNKNVKDMPDHLRSKKQCHEKHIEKLQNEMYSIVKKVKNEPKS